MSQTLSHHRTAFTLGFTLVEVLIGLVVLGLLMVLLSSSLFTLAKSGQAGEARLDAIDSNRLVRSFLRREIGSAFPVTLTDGKKDEVVFDGEAERLTFVGHLPAHRGGGGLQLLTVWARPIPGEPALMLKSRSLWAGSVSTKPDSADAERDRVLIEGINAVRFRYFGAPNDNTHPTWHDRWKGHDRLPKLVKVELKAKAGRAPPLLVVRIRSRNAIAQPQLLIDTAERRP